MVVFSVCAHLSAPLPLLSSLVSRYTPPSLRAYSYICIYTGASLRFRGFFHFLSLYIPTYKYPKPINQWAAERFFFHPFFIGKFARIILAAYVCVCVCMYSRELREDALGDYLVFVFPSTANAVALIFSLPCFPGKRAGLKLLIPHQETMPSSPSIICARIQYTHIGTESTITFSVLHLQAGWINKTGCDYK